ncbi:MAG: Gfo/Idh/MocA family oxidoreductase [Spirochaetales bacterium]|nr:Gfo/Idh/MocA family oxidoreductase [Spirochaetales bacterium]
MKQTVNCALAGLGRIAVTLEDDPLREKPASHLGAIEYNRICELTGASDPDEEKRNAFARRYPGCPLYGDTPEMIREVKPDILHIASETDTHMPLLKAALEERIPVIVCEKPLSNSLEEARALLDMVDASGSVVMVNHERRFSRDYQEVRGLVRDKALGELLSINCRLYMGRTRPPEKILYHDGTHMIDILRFITGEDLTVLGSWGIPAQEKGTLMVLASAGECMINLDVSGGRDHLVFELDLSFERGRIRIGNGVYEIWISEESPYYTGFRSLKKSCSEWSGRTAYFSDMMNHAVHLYKNPGARCHSSFRDGLRVLELIDDILRPLMPVN